MLKGYGAGARGSRVVVAIAVGYAALIGAWLMTSRPFSAPDEVAHYLRALIVADGHIDGAKAPNTLLAVQGPISSLGRRWEAVNSRAVAVPAALSPPGARCVDGRLDLRGSCVEGTYTGTYNPLPYLLPAAGLKISNTVSSASWLARAGSAIPCIVLLALALALLWDGTLGSVLGLCAALTPMVLFTSSVLSPSGAEIAASTAFLAALLRLAREPRGAPAWVWVAAAISGLLAILSWQLGPAFVAMDVVLFAALLGSAQGGAFVRTQRRRIGLTAALLVLALVLYVAYLAVAGGTPDTIALSKIGDLHAAVNELPPVLRQSVGTFGELTVPLPSGVEACWLVVIGAMLVAALWVGSRWERASLVLACAFAVVFPVAFEALVHRHTGFGMQGRYVLPVLMAVPMIAGETLQARAGAGGRWWLVLTRPVAVLLAVLQLVAWWVNARHSAGRAHTVWFLSGAKWTPPLGWWPWLVLAVAGAGAIAVGAAAGRDGRGPLSRAWERPSEPVGTTS